MTLGNSPQPLTRRQLRELARESEPSSAESSTVVEPAAPVDDESPVHHSRHTSPPVDGKAPVRAAPAPLPIPVDTPYPGAPPVSDSAVDNSAVNSSAGSNSAVSNSDASNSDVSNSDVSNSVVIDSVTVDPGRTLTRRELRALQAAASAGSDADEDGLHQDARDQHSPDEFSRDEYSRDADSRDAVPISVAAASVTPAAAVLAQSSPAGDVAAVSNGLHPPIGHWSVDRDDDSHIQTIGRRDDQTFDDLVGRGIGAGGIPTTTNALILPAIPRQGTAGPITSTGEIMITGSIDLPRSLGATGQHPNLFDSSEMDRMLDQLDEGGHHNDVAPVSASRAVSTHTSTRGVMTPPRKRGASLPTVLAITAAVLAIGVLSLFVIGYALNIY